jgi:hypothetical protein
MRSLNLFSAASLNYFFPMSPNAGVPFRLACLRVARGSTHGFRQWIHEHMTPYRGILEGLGVLQENMRVRSMNRG